MLLTLAGRLEGHCLSGWLPKRYWPHTLWLQANHGIIRKAFKSPQSRWPSRYASHGCARCRAAAEGCRDPTLRRVLKSALERKTCPGIWHIPGAPVPALMSSQTWGNHRLEAGPPGRPGMSSPSHSSPGQAGCSTSSLGRGCRSPMVLMLQSCCGFQLCWSWSCCCHSSWGGGGRHLLRSHHHVFYRGLDGWGTLLGRRGQPGRVRGVSGTIISLQRAPGTCWSSPKVGDCIGKGD